MKCNHCGAEVPDDSIFCENCGKKVGEALEASASKTTLNKKSLKTICFIGAGVLAIVLLAILLWPKSTTSVPSAPTDTSKLFPVKNSEGVYGYIDENGTMIIQPQFEEAEPFSEDLAKVMSRGKYGYINEKGSWVIQPQYAEARNFHEGMAAVSYGDNWGYIDKTGKMVIPPQYDRGHSFSEGLATINGFCIDKKGNIVLQSQDYSIVSSFHDGLAIAALNTNQPNSDQLQLGYIDKTGKIVIPFQYSWATKFSEGLALAIKPEEDEWRGKLNIIDKNGRIVTTNIEERRPLEGFHEGMAFLFSSDGGFIDQNGNTMNLCTDQQGKKYHFQALHGFSGGIAIVSVLDSENKDSISAIIDKSGKILNAMRIPSYTEGKIINGMAIFEWEETVGNNSIKKYYCINKTGKIVYQWKESSEIPLSDEIDESGDVPPPPPPPESEYPEDLFEIFESEYLWGWGWSRCLVVEVEEDLVEEL